jgi:hypothetical protein
MAKKKRTTKAGARRGKSLVASSKVIAHASRAAGGRHMSTPAKSSTRSLSPRETQSYRELFWQNVMREVLVSLMLSTSKDAAAAGAAGAGEAGGARSGATKSGAPAAGSSHVLDGRLGVITHNGQRIPIAGIFPVFAASMAHSQQELAMSALLQCTVFQVHTPGGEVFTLPLHEIRGFHSLTEGLMAELEANARAESTGESAQQEPFGFAAFTSLSRAGLPHDEGVQDKAAGTDAPFEGEG